MLKACWAYDFARHRPIAEVAALFNEAGPWQWQLRESAVYGDYLNCRPAAGIRLRLHEYPQTGEYGTFSGLRGEGFSALLEIESQSEATQSELDSAFRVLLRRIGITDPISIEPYD
jgi:hypothetical protein